MSTIKRATDKLRRITYRTLQTPKELARLREANGSSSTMLADAIEAVVHNRVSALGRVWIDKIEDLRVEMLASKREIVIDDFGTHAADAPPHLPVIDDGGVVIRTVKDAAESSSPQTWGLLLFELVSRFQPDTLIELGTGVGISAAYQAAALTLNGHGHLVTIEGADSLVELAEANLSTQLGLEPLSIVYGRFQDKLKPVLKDHGPVDMVFLDGHHDEEATVGYFEHILPYLSPLAIFVIDDINWSAGMERAWQQIIQHDRVDYAIDMVQFGICVIISDKGRQRYSKIVVT